MKKLFLAISLILPSAIVFAQKDSLERLLIEGNLFKIKQILDKDYKKMDKPTWLYYKCFLDNAFCKFDRSVKETELFLKTHTKGFDDTEIARIMDMQVYNYANIFEYQKASETADLVIKNYSKIVSPDRLDDITDINKILHALSKIPPQAMAAHGDVLVNIKKDNAGLWRLPVATAKGKQDFIFDTHANFSAISETGAKKMGLKRLAASADITSGATGMVSKSGLAIADSIIIGDSLKLWNVVFVVLPDSLLRANGYDFSYILGFPVILAMKEVQLSRKAGTLKIPARPTKNILRNLMIHELKPRILIATAEKDSLILEFDTGADSTDLFASFFDRFKNDVKKNGTLTTREQGGAGGVKKMEFYKMANFNFKIAFKTATLNSVYVRTKSLDDTTSEEIIYGNMGEDVLSLFDTIVINFDDMYVDFK